MEVHHHAHAHGKKTWKAYFWEFLMLFLAVFCGFLAENKREHIVERHRAKQYAQHLLADLQKDTAMITKAALYEGKTVRFIDSLVQYMRNPGMGKTGLLYYYIRFACWLYSADWNRSTLNQLINSGNLRYFDDDELVNKISSYYTKTTTISGQEDLLDTHRLRAIAAREHLLKAEYFVEFTEMSMRGLLAGEYIRAIDSLRQTEIPMASRDPDLLNSLTNALIATTSMRKARLSSDYPQAKEQAVEIMELLKKEYHLK